MEIFEQFLLFEQNNKLFEKEVKGFQYWIYIRQEIFAELSEIELENKKIKKDSRKNRVNWENILVSLLFHNPFLKKGNSTFLFFQDPTVYNPEKKYYECNITPTIVEYFRKETLLIAGFNLYEQKKRLRFPETTFLVKPVLQVI